MSLIGATMLTQCYDKFKEVYPDSYQDILLMHKEASLLGSSPQTIAQCGQGFQKHYRRVIQIVCFFTQCSLTPSCCHHSSSLPLLNLALKRLSFSAAK